MDLIPIKETLEENRIFADVHDCQEGRGGFKGRPLQGKVEIAYGTFERFRQQGFGSEICSQLVKLALKADSSVQITAHTLPATN